MTFHVIDSNIAVVDNLRDYAFLTLANESQECLPLLKGLYERYDNKTIFHEQQVISLKKEIIIIQRYYKATIAPQIIKQRQLHAKESCIFNLMLESILLKNPLYAFMNRLIELCDYAISQKKSIGCIGD